MRTDEGLSGGAEWRMAVAIVAAMTLLRLLILFTSPLQLYPDEAQYWVWSRHLALGYFSKPPMIAWLIRATTALGGQGEAWIRLSSPLLHGVAALALCRAGQRLYSPRAGLWAAIIYSLIPGVQLSSAIVATDGPLLCLLSLAVWAYAVFWSETDPGRRRTAALGLGVAMGLAFLTKYASLYVAGGVLLHAVASPEARRRWSASTVAIYLAVGLAIAAPNLGWNLAHHFQTVAHTAENADLGDSKSGVKGLFGARGPFGFLFGQFGVFGPVAFAVVIAASVQAFRRKGAGADTLLICLAAPALVLVLAESVAARANANWAAAAYAPAAVLAAGALDRWDRRRLFGWGIVALQGVVALAFAVVVLVPAVADSFGVGNAFKRARGWRQETAVIKARARAASIGGPLSAIAVDDRFLFNALSYYARDEAGRPAATLPAPLKMWVRLAKPANQAETEAPLTAADASNVLGVSVSWIYLPEFRYDFLSTTLLAPETVPLDPHHQRPLAFFVGHGFQRKPRDPKTGEPILPLELQVKRPGRSHTR